MPNPRRVVFAGTPEFAVPSLMRLIEKDFEILAVLTQPDKPKGRGRKLGQSPIKTLAQSHQIPVLQPEKLNSTIIETLSTINADVIVVVAYGLLIPKRLLKLPKFGCINVHSSLLPRWRGAAPIQYAVLAGDAVSGTTIMQMDEGLDTGPILSQAEYTLAPRETAQSLHDTLANLGADLLVETLSSFQQLTPLKQNDELRTYAKKISKSDGLLDWSAPAAQLDCQIRGYFPWPVCFSYYEDMPIRIFESLGIKQDMKQDVQEREPGEIISISRHGLEVACGEGALILSKIQLPAGKILSISDFLNARPNFFKLNTPFK